MAPLIDDVYAPANLREAAGVGQSRTALGQPRPVQRHRCKSACVTARSAAYGTAHDSVPGSLQRPPASLFGLFRLTSDSSVPSFSRARNHRSRN